MSPTPFTIEASGMTFSALKDGPDDGPLVLFLHGFPQFADSWSSLLPIIGGAGYRAVAVDQRGYAENARPDEVKAYKTKVLVQDILHIADALKADRFHIVGHDWGGFLAWHLAAKAPNRILSLTSVSTPHPAAYKRALLTDWDQRRRSLYLILFRAPFHLAERVLKFSNWKVFRALFQGRVSEDAVERNLERLGKNHGLTAALNWYRAHGGEAGPSHVPSLYIWGSDDVALSAKAATLTAEFVHGPYQFEVLTGLSHWLLDEAPEQIVALILSHLKRH